MDDLMPIGEFSRRSGLSPKRLRTYAAAGLLVPAAVDSDSGYRYYSPGQLHDARLIDNLRRARVPLTEIATILRQPSEASLEAWARRAHDDAARRQDALAAARRLLVAETPTLPLVETGTSGGIRMPKLCTAVHTETGPVREGNEDAASGNERLAAVADGIGGHPGGEIASAIAIALVEAAFTGRSLDELEAALRAANRAIWDRGRTSPGLEGMGTTMCAAGLSDDGRLLVANVGDSRAYLLHAGSLVQLTDDHSLTAELVRRGELSREEAARHPHHGILTRALGVGPHVAVDGVEVSMAQGDRLLVCSDGLFNDVADDEIRSVVETAADVDAAATGLVDMALSRGGRDNVSAVVAELCA